MKQEWADKLTAEQKKVLLEKGTEAPFSSKVLEQKEQGEYSCAACGNVLFKSDSKYDSTSPGLIGWPSFGDVAKTGSVKLIDDDSWGMHRTEAVCATCGGHLGHVFAAGDSPTGQHYCINGCALDFKPKNG